MQSPRERADQLINRITQGKPRDLHPCEVRVLLTAAITETWGDARRIAANQVTQIRNCPTYPCREIVASHLESLIAEYGKHSTKEPLAAFRAHGRRGAQHLRLRAL